MSKNASECVIPVMTCQWGLEFPLAAPAALRRPNCSLSRRDGRVNRRAASVSPPARTCCSDSLAGLRLSVHPLPSAVESSQCSPGRAPGAWAVPASPSPPRSCLVAAWPSSGLPNASPVHPQRPLCGYHSRTNPRLSQDPCPRLHAVLLASCLSPCGTGAAWWLE